jgi:hypothetical protein
MTLKQMVAIRAASQVAGPRLVCLVEQTTFFKWCTATRALFGPPRCAITDLETLRGMFARF